MSERYHEPGAFFPYVSEITRDTWSPSVEALDRLESFLYDEELVRAVGKGEVAVCMVMPYLDDLIARDSSVQEQMANERLLIKGDNPTDDLGMEFVESRLAHFGTVMKFAVKFDQQALRELAVRQQQVRLPGVDSVVLPVLPVLSVQEGSDADQNRREAVRRIRETGEEFEGRYGAVTVMLLDGPQSSGDAEVTGIPGLLQRSVSSQNLDELVYVSASREDTLHDLFVVRRSISRQLSQSW